MQWVIVLFLIFIDNVSIVGLSSAGLSFLPQFIFQRYTTGAIYRL